MFVTATVVCTSAVPGQYSPDLERNVGDEARDDFKLYGDSEFVWIWCLREVA